MSAADAQSISLTADGRGTKLTLGEEMIGLALTAKADLQPHAPTKRELAEQKKYDDDGWGRRAFPEHDRIPSATLSLALEGASWSGLRRNFNDRQAKPLEDQLGDVIAAVAAHAALLKQRRDEAAERERRWEEDARRKRRQEAFDARERRRMQFAEAIHGQLEERARLKMVLTHLEAEGKGGVRLRHMEAWLRRRITQVGAMVDPRALHCSAQIAKVEFDEAAVQAGPEADRVPHYYPDAVELLLWRFDEVAGKATSVSGLDWAKEFRCPD